MHEYTFTLTCEHLDDVVEDADSIAARFFGDRDHVLLESKARPQSGRSRKAITFTYIADTASSQSSACAESAGPA